MMCCHVATCIRTTWRTHVHCGDVYVRLCACVRVCACVSGLSIIFKMYTKPT